MGLGVAFTGHVKLSVLLKRTRASETQRTQTRLYLRGPLSQNQRNGKTSGPTFGLRNPNRKQKDGNQHKILPKSLIPSERGRCHPSQSTKPNHPKPLSTTLWHGPARTGTTNPLTILIYRPSNLQVVDFVVRCVEVDGGCCLIREFLTDLGFSRGGTDVQDHLSILWISIRWARANLHSWPTLPATG